MRRVTSDRTYLKRGFSDDEIRDEFERILSDLPDILDRLETRDLSDAEFLARGDHDDELLDILWD